jgi:hypothetical protein
MPCVDCDPRPTGISWKQRVRIPAVFLALVLLNLHGNGTAQTADPIGPPVRLASGEQVSYWGLLSYNKLRRGTDMELTYEMFIRPDACFLLADNVASGGHALKLVITASPGLVTSAVKASAHGRQTTVNGVKVPNCSDEVRFRAKVSTQPDQPLGMNRLAGKITWQAVNATGVLPPQTTSFEFPIEIVERGDRTAKYNESYGYRAKPDLIWRIPTFPFVLIYCVASGDCPD